MQRGAGFRELWQFVRVKNRELWQTKLDGTGTGLVGKLPAKVAWKLSASCNGIEIAIYIAYRGVVIFTKERILENLRTRGRLLKNYRSYGDNQ